jgi:hypothetical protein
MLLCTVVVGRVCTVRYYGKRINKKRPHCLPSFKIKGLVATYLPLFFSCLFAYSTIHMMHVAIVNDYIFDDCFVVEAVNAVETCRLAGGSVLRSKSIEEFNDGLEPAPHIRGCLHGS